MATDTLALDIDRALQYAEGAGASAIIPEWSKSVLRGCAELRRLAALAAPPVSTDTREKEYVAIANLAQEATGRSVWPSTVKAVLEAAATLARPAAGSAEREGESPEALAELISRLTDASWMRHPDEAEDMMVLRALCGEARVALEDYAALRGQGEGAADPERRGDGAP